MKRSLCKNCVYFYILKPQKAYCENNHFQKIPLTKAKLFEPLMFDCIEFEEFKPK